MASPAFLWLRCGAASSQSGPVRSNRSLYWYALIRDPQRGSCLYKCGNERYLLQVQAPEYKQTIFGTAGGR